MTEIEYFCIIRSVCQLEAARLFMMNICILTSTVSKYGPRPTA